jgi:hypothetical protein
MELGVGDRASAEDGWSAERRALQAAILLAGCVPVFGGAAGALLGERAFGPFAGAGTDSHVRYLSGLLLAIGLTYWSCVPTIERRGEIVRALTVIVFIGGLARLGGVFAAGDPGAMRWALLMELGVAPLIGLWQGRVARGPGVPRRPR